MELSTGQQRAVFAVVVVGLAVLGLYLVGPALHHGSRASASPRASASVPSSSAGSPAPVAVAPSGATAGPVNIYDWLPFTQQDLATAAGVTESFCAAQEDFSYTESGTAYAARLAGLATGDLVQELTNAYLTPGVAQQRTSQRQVSTASATIDSLRTFGPTSLTFVVTVNQRLLSTRGTATSSTQYAITVVSAAGGWQVNDIELATQGNF